MAESVGRAVSGPRVKPPPPNPVGVALLSRRASLGLDLWTGEQLPRPGPFPPPLRWLLDRGRLSERTLYYLCGAGLSGDHDLFQYDPEHHDVPFLLDERYDAVVCLFPADVAAAVRVMHGLLSDDGVAYLAVPPGRKELPLRRPVLAVEKPGFALYRFHRRSQHVDQVRTHG